MRIIAPIVFLCALFHLVPSSRVHAQILDSRDPVYKPFFESHEKILKSFSILNSNPLLKDYDVKFYKLDISADNKSDNIQGNVTMLARVQNNPLSTLVVELHNGLVVDRILVNGEEKQFSHVSDEISIPLGHPLDTGEMVMTQIFYGGQTGGGMVTETDENWDVPVTYTSSEPFFQRTGFHVRWTWRIRLTRCMFLLPLTMDRRLFPTGSLPGQPIFLTGR